MRVGNCRVLHRSSSPSHHHGIHVTAGCVLAGFVEYSHPIKPWHTARRQQLATFRPERIHHRLTTLGALVGRRRIPTGAPRGAGQEVARLCVLRRAAEDFLSFVCAIPWL